MLNIPGDDQLLYKVISVENLLQSIKDRYLHFNRVDSYSDFPGADHKDGEQLPADRNGNASSKFKSDPTFSVADYYDRARSRTYACCFSLENSQHIWEQYGKGGNRGKVCLVFNFGKLRGCINHIVSGESYMMIGDNRCRQIFSVNYGNIRYADWNKSRLNERRLPNPIQYIYLKDRSYAKEKEHRISLSALGFGDYNSKRLGIVSFPQSLPFEFDFKQAIQDKTLHQCLFDSECDVDFLYTELRSLGLEAIGS